MRSLRVLFLFSLLLGLFVVAGSASADQEVCPEGNGWTAHITVSDTSYTYTAPPGYLITAWCYKAATTVVYGIVDPPASSVTVESTVLNDNDQVQDISHASFLLIEDPGDPTPTEVPPTEVPPTEVPPTEVPPTEVPPTEVPPTEVPPTEVPPTEVPPTEVPPTEVPPTEVPPTEVPPTEVPPTEVPPTEVPPTEVPPTEVVPTEPPGPEIICQCGDGTYGCYAAGTAPEATVVYYFFDANGNGVEDPGESVTAETCFAPSAPPQEPDTGLGEDDSSLREIVLALLIGLSLVSVTYVGLQLRKERV